ncbi:MAG: hypothetical protein HY738_02540 [Bacteroidia bacterium]|nr:hypothetical protein [Bacteroidia bacterium]
MKYTKLTPKKDLIIAAILVAISSGIVHGQINNSNSSVNINNGNALWKPIGQDTVFTERIVKIGNGTLVIDASTATTGLPNQINSTSGAISFGYTGSPYSNIKLGVGTTEPGYTLDVNDDINVTPSAENHGYRIGGVVVLQNPGTSNIFVGFNNFS